MTISTAEDPFAEAGTCAAVVVAVESAATNLANIMSRLTPAAHPDVEFLICHSGPLGLVGAGFDGLRNVRCVESMSDSRIPHLWRDGFLACRSEKVALLTAHCIPELGWIDVLKSSPLPADVAAIGGFFNQAADAGGADWAIYLLRYVNYSRPRSASDVDNVAADNAVYRRSAVMDCKDLLQSGFWEPSFHERFRRKRLRLIMNPSLQVLHRNRYSAAEFAAQRRVHGLEFGTARAQKASSPRRVVLGLAMPLAPVILVSRVIAGAIRSKWIGQFPWSAYPWLAWFVLNWSIGEARGTWHVLFGRSRGCT